jgi:hypothetical protein
MSTITEPGVTHGLPAERYHAGDITPEPALSSSLAVVMTEKCARKVWHQHPALNPNFEPVQRKQFDLGGAAHARVLEGEKFRDMVEIIIAPDYKTKAAQTARDDAYAKALIPVLEHQVGEFEDMAAEVMDHPIAGLLMARGRAEQSLFWRDRSMGIWCKARPDWHIPADLVTPELIAACEWSGPAAVLVNYKTHGGDTDPDSFGRHVGEMAYVQRAAWEIEALFNATGERVGHYVILSQEVAPPYLVTAYELQRNDLEYGRDRNRVAQIEFARCLAQGKDRKFWPGYRTIAQPDRDTLIPLELPPWKRMRLEEDRVKFIDRQKARRDVRLAASTSAKTAHLFAP